MVVIWTFSPLTASDKGADLQKEKLRVLNPKLFLCPRLLLTYRVISSFFPSGFLGTTQPCEFGKLWVGF